MIILWLWDKEKKNTSIQNLLSEIKCGDLEYSMQGYDGILCVITWFTLVLFYIFFLPVLDFDLVYIYIYIYIYNGLSLLFCPQDFWKHRGRNVTARLSLNVLLLDLVKGEKHVLYDYEDILYKYCSCSFQQFSIWHQWLWKVETHLDIFSLFSWFNFYGVAKDLYWFINYWHQEMIMVNLLSVIIFIFPAIRYMKS